MNIALNFVEYLQHVHQGNLLEYIFLIINLSMETGHSPQVKTFPSVLNTGAEKV